MPSTEKTQYQSSDDLLLSQDLSLDERKPPANVPGYTLKSFLGSGAYGEVWLGIDSKTSRKVAIKFYTRKTSLDFTMLSREVEKLVFLSADRYVVQLLDVGWDAQPPYYVMDYIEHGSLEDELRRKTKIPVEEAVDLFEEIAIGLMHLHGKGILHCDLKPGNVLLDQDKKPRLADFGQSRLSHEQAPALGTLFFMAPEQADMKAVPDARWDVYALGALLYSMITGNPPYRDDEVAGKLESSDSLESRLKTYKTMIQNSPKPTAHRQVPGIDKLLGDIISRCIAGDPKQRYSSIQSVLLALRQRKETMARRPLMLLGILGPLVLLGLMSGFAWWAYSEAVSKSDREFTEKAIESNKFAAMFGAKAVEETINDYFDAVRLQLDSQAFQDLYSAYLQNDELQELALKFVDPSENDSGLLAAERKQFYDHEIRQALNREIATWMARKRLPRASSWFICDRYGVQVAAEWDKAPETITIGQNWSYRSYFQSGEQDAQETGKDGIKRYLCNGLTAKHITGQKVSAVFNSAATNTWKVAFSIPIEINGSFEGIVGMTVEMGEFVSFDIGKSQYAMLVNGLPGEHQGIVLEHPMIREQQGKLKKDEKLPIHLTNKKLNMTNLAKGGGSLVDPLGYDPNDKGGNQKWIAAYVPVKRTNSQGERMDTGLYLVSAQDADSVLEPSRELGRQMMNLGLSALLAFLAVTGGLAYLVFRSIRQSRRLVSRFYGSGSDSTSTPSSFEARTLLGTDRTQ